MGNEFFVLGALAITVAVLGKRATVKTYALMGAAAAIATAFLYLT